MPCLSDDHASGRPKNVRSESEVELQSTFSEKSATKNDTISGIFVLAL